MLGRLNKRCCKKKLRVWCLVTCLVAFDDPSGCPLPATRSRAPLWTPSFTFLTGEGTTSERRAAACRSNQPQPPTPSITRPHNIPHHPVTFENPLPSFLLHTHFLSRYYILFAPAVPPFHPLENWRAVGSPFSRQRDGAIHPSAIAIHHCYLGGLTLTIHPSERCDKTLASLQHNGHHQSQNVDTHDPICSACALCKPARAVFSFQRGFNTQ